VHRLPGDELKNTFSKGAVVVAIVVGVLANAGSLIVPFFLTVLAHTRSLTEAQGGLFAMAEFGGIGLGAMGCAVLPSLIQRLNWRRAAALGLVAVIVGNLAMSTPVGLVGLFALALAAGIGAGMVNAVAYAIFAEGDGARLVAAFTAAQMGLGALGVGLVSGIVDHHGDALIFLVLAGLGGAALLLCRLLPARSLARPTGERNAAHESDRISGLGWAAVLGLFIFFVGSGAIYSFVGYMGLAWGGKPSAVESMVSGIMFAGMLGAVIVTVVGSRFGYRWPVAIAMVGAVLGLTLFIIVKPLSAFLPVGGLLYFSVTVATSYLFSVLTDIDRSTGAAMMMAASQVSGYAIGPAIAGYLVTPNYVLVNGFVLSLFLCASLIVIGVVWMHRRQPRRSHIDALAQMDG
jgi:MFS family permease